MLKNDAEVQKQSSQYTEEKNAWEKIDFIRNAC